MAKILYIGLGGTGVEIVNVIRKLNNHDEQRYKYLTIDAQGSDINLQIHNVSQQVNDYREQISGWWYPEQFNAEGDEALEGFLQKRYLGRLGYFLRSHNVRHQLRNALEALTPGGEPIRIFVITSASGGAGSSYFVDIGFLLQSIRQENNFAGKLFGVVLDEEIVAKTYPARVKDTIKNGVAFWSEVDYYMTSGRGYRFNLPDNTRIEVRALRAFDGIYYFGYENRKGEVMNAKDDYVSLVAHFMHFHSNIANWIILKSSHAERPPFENFLDVFSGEGGARHASLNYSSGGYVQVRFPRADVAKYIARKVTVSFLNELRSSRGEEDIPTKTTTFLEKLNLLQSDNRNQLVESEGRRALNERSFSWTQISGALKSDLEQNEKNELERTVKARLSDFPGNFIEVGMSFKVIVDQIEKHFTEALETLCGDIRQDGRIGYLEKFLRKLKEQLEFEATRGLQSERDFLKKLVNHQGNIIEACSKLKQQQGRFFLFRSKREILGARDALVMEFRKYHNFEFMKTVLPSIEDLYQRLIAVTDNHLAQISLAKPVIDQLLSNIKTDFLPENSDIVGHKNREDFILNILTNRHIVEKSFMDELDASVIDQVKRNVLDQIHKTASYSSLNPQYIAEQLDNLNTDIVLKNTIGEISLEKALTVEAEYFYDRICRDYDRVCKDNQKQQEFLTTGVYVSIFGEAALQNMAIILNSREKSKERCIETLVEGRLTETLDLLYPFWKIDTTANFVMELGGVRDVITSIKLNKTANQRITSIVERFMGRFNGFIGGDQNTFSYIELTDDSVVELASWEYLLPLSAVSIYRNGPYVEAERLRVSNTLNYDPHNAHPHQFGNNDLKFILNHYSFIPQSPVAIVDCSGIIALGEVLGTIQVEDPESRKKFMLGRNLRNFQEGYPLGDSNEELWNNVLFKEDLREELSDVIEATVKEMQTPEKRAEIRANAEQVRAVYSRKRNEYIANKEKEEIYKYLWSALAPENLESKLEEMQRR